MKNTKAFISSFLIILILGYLVISNIGKLIGSLGLGGNVTEFLKDTGKEPYIVSTIPETQSDLFSGRTINSNF